MQLNCLIVNGTITNWDWVTWLTWRPGQSPGWLSPGCRAETAARPEGCRWGWWPLRPSRRDRRWRCRWGPPAPARHRYYRCSHQDRSCRYRNQNHYLHSRLSGGRWMQLERRTERINIIFWQICWDKVANIKVSPNYHLSSCWCRKDKDVSYRDIFWCWKIALIGRYLTESLVWNIIKYLTYIHEV